jgi:hypothetical protein
MALQMQHGIAALLTMAYAAGAPDVAPVFPRTMEVALSKYHSDFNEVGKKLYISGVALAHQTGISQSTPQYQAASAVSGPVAR